MSICSKVDNFHAILVSLIPNFSTMEDEAVNVPSEETVVADMPAAEEVAAE